MKNFSNNMAGAAAIEFAIVSPVFILIVIGMLAYGIYLGAAHSVQQLAADAARASIAGLNEEERRDLAQSFIDLNAPDYTLINPDHLVVKVEGSDSDVTQFRVSVIYDAKQLPIWNLYLPLPLPSRQIERASTIRVGGV